MIVDYPGGYDVRGKKEGQSQREKKQEQNQRLL